MKNSLILLSGLAFAASAVSGQIIYTQPFDNPGGDANLESSPWNWSWAINAGGGRPGGSSIARVSGGEFGFSAQNTNDMRELISWYDGSEVESIGQGTLSGFSIDLRHGSTASETRFVIRIGDDWFATTLAFSVDVVSDTDWVTRTWDFTNAGSAWTPILNDDDPFDGISGQDGGTGFDLVGTGTLTGMDDPLPSGVISAVGVLNRSAGNDWPDSAIRYDNFTVIPEPSAYAALLALAALALVAYRRRTRA